MFRCLYDFSYECDIREALVFYFFYAIFVGYFVLGIAYSFYDGVFGYLVYSLSNTFDFNYEHFIYAVTDLIPFIFCTAISTLIILKKDLRDPFSIFLLGLTFLLTLISPSACTFYSGLIPASILMTMEDRSEKIQQELDSEKKKQIKLAIKLERELAKERVRKLINELRKKDIQQTKEE